MSKIIRILKVEDTRKYEEEPDGRFHPIPGSGSEHECDRCGRIHEVHATVLTDDGQTLTVGTGCMMAESTDIARALLRLDHAAKRLAECRAVVATILSALSAYDNAYREVERLRVPDVTKWPATDADRHWVDRQRNRTHPDYIYRCGDASVYADDDYQDGGNRDMACWDWHHKRMTERGFPFGRYTLECKNGHDLKYYRKQIAKLEQSVKEGAT